MARRPRDPFHPDNIEKLLPGYKRAAAMRRLRKTSVSAIDKLDDILGDADESGPGASVCALIESALIEQATVEQAAKLRLPWASWEVVQLEVLGFRLDEATLTVDVRWQVCDMAAADPVLAGTAKVVIAADDTLTVREVTLDDH